MCSVYACFAHPADNSRVLDGHAWASRWHGDVANGGMATVPGHGGGYGWSTQITDFLVLGVGETEATFKAQALLAQMSDCSEPQTLTAGSVGCHARALGYQRSPTLPLTPQEPPLAMPLVLYRIVDVFDGLERNEDGPYEDGYSRIQTRELIEGFSLKSLPGHRGHRSDRRSSRLSARARMLPESSSGTIAKGLGGHP